MQCLKGQGDLRPPPTSWMKVLQDRIRRGGLSVCIFDAWCSVTVSIDGQRLPDVQIIIRRWQYYYYHHHAAAVYIHPNAS